MPERTFVIRFKSPDLRTQSVIAARAEIQDEHLVLLKSDGKLAALYLLEVVESWSELESL